MEKRDFINFLSRPWVDKRSLECFRCFLLLLNFPITYPFSLNRTKEKESNRRGGGSRTERGNVIDLKGDVSGQALNYTPPPPTLLQPIDPAVLPKSGWWRTLSASVLQWEKRGGECNCTGSTGQVWESADIDSNLTKVSGPSLIISDFYFILERITWIDAASANIIDVRNSSLSH